VRLSAPVDVVRTGGLAHARLAARQREVFDPSRREDSRHSGLLSGSDDFTVAAFREVTDTD
jgi:hypothetical protein